MDEKQYDGSIIRMNKSVSIHVTFQNENERSLFKRLMKYSKDKGIKIQDTVRFAASMFMDKAGY